MLHALYSKSFSLIYVRSIRNLITRKNCSYIVKATEYYQKPIRVETCNERSELPNI